MGKAEIASGPTEIKYTISPYLNYTSEQQNTKKNSHPALDVMHINI